MTEEKIAAPASHWRRRTRTTPLPHAQAKRQGRIIHLAFVSLGKEGAIAFLNTEHPGLGGRPLDVATVDEAGQTTVSALLHELARANALDGQAASTT